MELIYQTQEAFATSSTTLVMKQRNINRTNIKAKVGFRSSSGY